MSEFNNQKQYRIVSIRDQVWGRQANNLLEYQLGEAVRPWYSGEDQQSLSWALNALDEPARRDDAAAFLGLEILAAS